MGAPENVNPFGVPAHPVWVLPTRCNPVEDIDDLRQTWSRWLDLSPNPREERPCGSEALIGACDEYRSLREFSPRTRLAHGVYERSPHRWAELGLQGHFPTLTVLEEYG